MLRTVRQLCALMLATTILCGAGSKSSKKTHRLTREDVTRQMGQAGGGAAIRLKDGEVLFSVRAEERFVPASTIKVPVACMALHRWGRGYRFPTEIYLDSSGTLFMKGMGDPFLISEEIELLAGNLVNNGLKSISRVLVDDSTFAPRIEIPGSVRDNEPYNATVGALSANFNSILLRKTSQGDIVSGESQTPLTSLAKSLGAPSGGPTLYRRNIPPENHAPAIHTGQILIEMLKKKGVAVLSDDVFFSVVPVDLKPFYVHRSSHRLYEVMELLLEHSNNFMANQLFLALAADQAGRPGTLENGCKVLEDYLMHDMDIEGAEIVEGSGLCRENKISPMDLCHVLRAFSGHRDLMKIRDDIQGKTGTLSGVRCLTGYFTLKSGEEICFALLMSGNAPYRWTLAESLKEALNNDLGVK